MLKRSVTSDTSSIWELDLELWKRGGTLRLPVRGSSLPWICRNTSSPLLVIVPNQRDLSDFRNDWNTLFQNPINELREIPLDADSVLDPALYVQRGETLKHWRSNREIMVATPGALITPVRESSSNYLMDIGTDIPRKDLVLWLNEQGYHQSENVWSPGQYVLRGSIIDIYDPVYHYPIRLEFFDETLEQIRLFKPRDQKSVGLVNDLELHGVKSDNTLFPVEMLPLDLHVLLYESGKIEDQAENYLWLWQSLGEKNIEPPFQRWKEVYQNLKKNPLIRVTRSEIKYDTFSTEVKIYPCPHFKGRVEALQAQCRTWIQDEQHIVLYSTNERFQGLAKEMGIPSFNRFLSKGFLDRHTGSVILSDLELSGLTLSPSQENDVTFPLEWNRKLSSGDWIIHEDYGVACFSGLETVQMDDTDVDMFVLQFAEEKRLLMPVTQFSKLSRLSLLPGTDVIPDSLGGKKWKKQISKDREKARQEAKVLLELYAAREILKGTAFPKDGEYLGQLERSFPFVETADQLTAIEAVKKDMECHVPMDRLIVGDVGYGKTEVAIRAAMKAVESGKQVVVLVPTTILAQQHYNTFVTRMSGFPVRTEVLSRFIKPSKQKTILQDIRDGKVDIVIGTQRLLQKDIGFRDLGLLIVDEEHRFGVMHKEKIKDCHRHVDVMTLTATPIPRTLSMSLRGLKGISVISTPPENRMPVVTFVGPWRDDVVKKAISREFNRGGQIFFVHNRVDTIEKRAAILRSFFPNAVITVAHGQMKENELEKNMLSFYSGETDMLVCTTIVESGLDVGRANTILIDDAHELGLAQLYQLRGRIGRRGEAGYAFFFYPENKVLSKDATERLEAIANLGVSGSGYNLSLQDLNIRGGGELVGTRQHGRSSRMGFDYYYELLEEEINKLRGHELSEPEMSLEIGVTIPGSYIPQEGVRISLYRRLLQVSDVNELKELESEISDRFGPLPQAVRYLLDVCMIRKLGSEMGISSIISRQKETVVEYAGNQVVFSRLAKPGWIFKETRAVGPGGFKGMRSFLEMAVRMKSLNDIEIYPGGEPRVG